MIKAAYGSWVSPLTPQRVAEGPSFPQFWLGQIEVDTDNAVYALLRGRDKSGRSAVVRIDGVDDFEEVTPSKYNVRTMIYEYGGTAFAVFEKNIWFINQDDQRIYRTTDDGGAVAVTSSGPYRYGAPIFDAHRKRLICIREQNLDNREPKHTLVAIDAYSEDDGHGAVLIEGDDFYAWPSLSPDGKTLAFIHWNHPHTPWDVTALSLAELDDDGRVETVRVIIQEDKECVMDPVFDEDGALYYCTDRSGWWRIHKSCASGDTIVCHEDVEFGRPLWQIGATDYHRTRSGALFSIFSRDGENQIGLIDPQTGALKAIDAPYTYYGRSAVIGDIAYVAAAGPTIPMELVKIDLKTGATKTLLRAQEIDDLAGFLSPPRHMSIPSVDGRQTYGFYYPPTNKDYEGPDNAPPPLLMCSHGGPTGCTNTTYNPNFQFWTSRGFAIFDINYAGSTGYGRAYRHLLRGGWGKVDVEDHVAAAQYLAREGYADLDRIAVRGWSAGGFNTLACLAFADSFAAGAAYYCISDISVFDQDTHKFESRYTDYLVGPRESAQDLYRERSPLHSVDKIDVPLALFQGDEDKITPQSQSDAIFESLKARGVPVFYKVFKGEGHGFRRTQTNLDCLKSELAFYGRVFGFEPAGDIPKIEFHHGDGR